MFYICEDKQKMAPKAVQNLLKQTYWASNRPLDKIVTSIAWNIQNHYLTLTSLNALEKGE